MVPASRFPFSSSPFPLSPSLPTSQLPKPPAPPSVLIANDTGPHHLPPQMRNHKSGANGKNSLQSPGPPAASTGGRGRQHRRGRGNHRGPAGRRLPPHVCDNDCLPSQLGGRVWPTTDGIRRLEHHRQGHFGIAQRQQGRPSQQTPSPRAAGISRPSHFQSARGLGASHQEAECRHSDPQSATVSPAGRRAALSHTLVCSH